MGIFFHIQKFIFPIVKSNTNSPPHLLLRSLLHKPFNSFSPDPCEVSSPAHSLGAAGRTWLQAWCGTLAVAEKGSSIARPQEQRASGSQLSKERRQQLACRSLFARLCRPSCCASCRGSAPGVRLLGSPAAGKEGNASNSPSTSSWARGAACTLQGRLLNKPFNA